MEQASVWDSLLTEPHSAPEEWAWTPFILPIISISPWTWIPLLTPLALQPSTACDPPWPLKDEGESYWTP